MRLWRRRLVWIIQNNYVMNPAIFHAYDIRGLSPQEIDETIARRLGKAIARLHQPKSVIVGRDMRATSEALQGALIEGLTASGVHVTRIGLCSTPMFNFALGESGGDLGVMVTASHNPAAYNGFKMAKAGCVPIGQGSGMEELRDLVLSEEALLDASAQGTVTDDEGVLERYLDRVFALADLPKKIPATRVAMDAGNGMEGLLLPKIRARLPSLDVMKLYWDPDGTFPHHEANPLKVETLADLRQSVLKDQCVFGVAFDGDADRVGFVDEAGEPIPGDILTVMLALEVMREKGAGKIVYDLRSSWSVPEIIRERGGEAIMSRVGHAFIKQKMRESGALFAGEVSMHFYFSDLWNCESGDLAMLLLLKMVLREGKPLSELWKTFRCYAHSGEINYSVQNAPAILAKIHEAYASFATDQSSMDGLRMEFRRGASDDWWFNLRPSNTEPLLRLNLEARSVPEMERRKGELEAMILRPDVRQ